MKITTPKRGLTALEAIDTLLCKVGTDDDICFANKERNIKHCVDCNISDSMKEIQKLIDRATPMNLIEHHYEVIGEEPYIKYNCPNCNNRAYPHMKFCSNCGQAIDWSDEDET